MKHPYSNASNKEFRDQTGSNGANLSWPQAFGVPDSPGSDGPVPGVDYNYNSWIVGVVNAGPYIASAGL